MRPSRWCATYHLDWPVSWHLDGLRLVHTGGAAEAKLPAATFAAAEHTSNISDEGHVLLAKSDGDDHVVRQARSQAADRHVVNTPRIQVAIPCGAVARRRVR